MKKRLTLVSGIIIYPIFIILLYIFRPQPNVSNSLWYALDTVIVAFLGTVTSMGTIFVMSNVRFLMPYWKKLQKYDSLLYLLVKRDFLAKYKRSFLGILWSLLNPLLTMIVMVIVFSYIFRFDIQNFPVYVLSGQIIYNLFTEATTTAMGSVLGNASLIKKVALPKYIFPFSKVITSLVNMMFSLVAFLIVMLVTKEKFHLIMLLMVFPILYTCVFSLGVGMFLSAELVYFRDINYLYSLLIFTMGYFTPLFYPISIIPDKYLWIIKLNPLYHFVECFRSIALYGKFPTITQNIICILLATASLVVGVFIFSRKQKQFILNI